MCIALVDIPRPFDVHLTLALTLLRHVDQHNASTIDESRRFQIRIGIGENIDNIVTDVNGRQNVAGMGISTTQRVMSLADGGQIQIVNGLLSDSETTYGVQSVTFAGGTGASSVGNVSVSSGGTLPSTVTCPTDSVQVAALIPAWMVN